MVCARVSRVAGLLLLILAASVSAKAQTINVHLTIISTEPARLKITAEFPQTADAISFPNAYGSALGLADRVENVEARGNHDEPVVIRKLGTGEFQAAEKFTRISYEIDLSGPMPPAQGSHVSSLNSQQGILMLSDLLPRSLKGPGAYSSAQVELKLPAGWRSASNGERRGPNTFFIEEADKAVFLIAPKLTVKTERVDAKDVSVALAGDWPISETDALKTARQIVQNYSQWMDFKLQRNATVMLVPFPGDAGPQRWTAETRGNVVVLLLGRKGSRKQIASRLGIVLAHELFHLWVPNSLGLSGDYDWFFEGFTIYQALRMDLHLGLISFQDFLDTVARVYDSYLAAPDRESSSLLAAAENRWTTLSTLVYDKAMLVAFLYDLQLRSRSNCKASFDDLYRRLFHRPTAGQADANETIIGLVNAQLGQKEFANEYIAGLGLVNLEAVLAPYGIVVTRSGSETSLSLKDGARDAQEKVLKCLAKE